MFTCFVPNMLVMLSFIHTLPFVFTTTVLFLQITTNNYAEALHTYAVHKYNGLGMCNNPNAVSHKVVYSTLLDYTHHKSQNWEFTLLDYTHK